MQIGLGGGDWAGHGVARLDLTADAGAGGRVGGTRGRLLAHQLPLDDVDGQLLADGCRSERPIRLRVDAEDVVELLPRVHQGVDA